MKKTINNSEHYFWGENCEGWKFLDTETLNVTREMISPGKGEKMHFHSEAQQCFYIISGNATFEIEDKITEVSIDESFIIPAGKKHRILNNTESELHFLVISQPSTKNDRINIE